jgi:SAM-dependent methyltransferase
MIARSLARATNAHQSRETKALVDEPTATTSDDEAILQHYREEAEQHGHDASSTMADATTRELEIAAILSCLDAVFAKQTPDGDILEIGCGNGHLLALLRARYPNAALVGADYSPDMVELAASRGIERCEVRREDVRALSSDDARFDAVVSERCLVNLLDTEAQGAAIGELHRVLRPGGHVVFIEAFTDGLQNLNIARNELGLPPNTAPYHNLWFEPDRFRQALDGWFDVVDLDAEGLPPSNFLSSHYFVSRVLYPAVTRADIRYNTEFVRFFRFLPPQGNFSPIQLFLLRRVD